LRDAAGGVRVTDEFLVDGRRVGPDECRRLFDAPLPSRMGAVLARVRGPRLLDVGAYDGAFLAALVRERDEIDAVAVDYDEENLRIARFLHPELESQLVQGSVYDLPFDDATFDCVTFQEVIEHLEGAAQAIKELNRVLKAGGSLLISTPNVYYWRDVLHHVRAEVATRVRRRPPRLESLVFFAESPWNRHIHAWTPATLLTLLEVNGFSYAWHGYSHDERGAARLLLRAAPFLAPVLVIEVTKQADAPATLS
jgi:2-polyprenyl-3-methyl-5-hydroxy-6-metoxy-1,4-benzoquinol methylase